MNVDELLHKHKIVFRTSGNDLLVHCFNPDHEDSNPSMRINKSTGVYHCFSCGFKGNVYSRYNVAVSRLHKARVRLKDKIEVKKVETVRLQIPEKAEFFDQEYRGISASTYLHFKAFTYDLEPSLLNRLVIPIYDITGKISCFLGRSFDQFEKAKYKVYPTKAQVPFFPMVAKPYQGSIILVEGIFDMLNLWDKGVKHVMATLGTQTVTEEKLQLLQLLGIHKIYIFFDGDTAGQKAAEKLIPLCESLGFTVENIVYNEQDPGSLSTKQIERLRNSKWPTY